MTKKIRSALEALYAANDAYQDYASRAPLGFHEEVEAELDQLEDKIEHAEDRVADAIRSIEDEDEAYSVQSLMHQWYRIPRYLMRHAA